jgi:hypothetical protein
MATKGSSKHKSDAYKAYQAQSRMETNRRKKLKRALKRNPGNAEQINAAIHTVKYRRKTPKSSNSTTPKAIKAVLDSKVLSSKSIERKMYKLSVRAHNSTGNLTWTF